MQRPDVMRTLGSALPVIGMVHLPPLPGAPGHRDMAHVVERACLDARVLADGGVSAIMVENFGDAPFFPDAVPPETVAGLAIAVAEVRRVTTLPIGVNVLRNDARAALGVAVTAGAAFIRVNVHTGAMLTDQGWIAGRAHDTLRHREALRADVAILADVLVKHAVAPAGLDVASAARDTWERGRADGLIVSGAATGAATAPDRLRAVREAVPDAPLFVGSGLTADNAAVLLAVADGAIVGSALQQGGRAGAPIAAERVRRLLDAVHSARNSAR
jgi:uncharacterized protein